MILFIVCLGYNKYEGQMPMAGTNSRAISAACHVLPRDVEAGHLQPLRWGVVHIGEDGVGHCSFTTVPDEDIMELEAGRLYK